MKRIVELHNLNTVPYINALHLQMELRAKRLDDEIPDQLLILEHPPVFTMGKRKIEDDFLISRKEVENKGIEIVETNRGGRVTYHGPGQLMAYFIFKIDNIGVKNFVNMLEEVCVETCKSVGVYSEASEEHPGVWVENNKVAAIGLNVERNVTMHGVAVNVNCDLEPYKYIVACGISNKGISTLAKESKTNITVDQVRPIFISKVESVLGCQIIPHQE